MRAQSHPAGIGDAAPNFPLATGHGDASLMLSGLRGTTVLLILSPPHWDPAFDLLAALYPGDAGGRVVREHRAEVAELFGARDTTALFVIDEHGVIQLRFIAGVDAIPAASPVTDADLDAGNLMPAAPSTTTRRDFVQAMSAAAALLAFVIMAPPPLQAAVPATSPTPTARAVTLNVNGRDITVDIEPRVTLLDALREYAGLTGTKKGCDHGQCGACTVHVDGRRTLSCMTFAMMQQGARITTIEGIASGDTLHPMQQAFITHDGFQCGYCTSGQIMSATAVVKEPWGPGDDAIREAMSGNICRCGAYPGILAAVQSQRGVQR